ncbi:cobalamin biosynthesis protein CobQ [Piscirickettsia salmonis]|uniref:Sporulation initiation inhibitor protein soj n=1 Tax=Piscirickettsia salmonis TaxID=1238 RepID=A0A9Q5VDF5_PISSA|nr:ParA family protein [Piscirickettsia salmonis]ALA24495.1 cobQ/CobB/MinD/ParA nucleotide-binding domain protein [Piscirickettsia salmonis]APS44849.1 cobalamin biosynthesis protein CobQ [Piscirickettsia salmonis]APS48210.1 cobalamin biosynthesis protein CobQ [Piscirickettsia salmonis]APS49478.1 cobalamin biosynthesis protein CobQ [Piscirickettsia salmonis]APS52655.1 cobalamin biosynthesis protein CobQ [Piscirickettsia salmonis]
MKIWTVANQKGGVGKTTTAVTLGGILASQGKRVLLLDLDPHGSLTSYLGYSPDKVEKGAYELFLQKGRMSAVLGDQIIKRTNFADLWLIPASITLATLDRQLGTQEGMGLLITKALKKLRVRYDYVIIDCPPILGVLMVNALAACEKVIIPAQTEFLALKGLERMIDTLAMVKKTKSFNFSTVILPTMFDRRTSAALGSLKILEEQYKKWLWRLPVPVDTKLREASQLGVPISQLYPQSRGLYVYQQFLDYLLESGAGSEMAQPLMSDPGVFV